MDRKPLGEVRDTIQKLVSQGASMAEVDTVVRSFGYTDKEIRTGLEDKGGAGPGIRAAAGLKMTPEGKADFLRSRLGAENVAITRDGTIGFRTAPDQPFQMFDEQAFSLGDVADVSGAALQAAPAIGATVATANPVAAAAGGLAGNLLRQSVSAAMPGDDRMTASQRGLSAALDAGLAGAAQYGSNRLFGLRDAVRPHNVYAGRLGSLSNTRDAQAGRAAAQAVGEPLTIGQETGSRTMLLMEGLARRAPFSAEKVAQKDLAQAEAIKNRFGSIIESVYRGGDVGAEQAGAIVTRAYNGAVSGARSARSRQAAIDFGRVDQLSGGAPVFGLSNTVRALDELIKEFDVPALKNDTTQKTVRWLMQERQRIARRPPMPDPSRLPGPANPNLAMTGNQFQSLLSHYGKAATGTGRVIPDLKDANVDKMIAARIFGALNDDLEAAATGGGIAENVAQALSAARSNWKTASGQIDEMTSTALGRMLGGKIEPAPEAIADKFSTMKPSHVRQVMGVLESADPSAANAIRAHYLGRILERSFAPMERARAGAPEILSPNRLGTQVGKVGERARMMEIVGPRVTKDIDELMEYAGRVADRAGTDGSPTAPLLMALEAVKSGSAAIVMTPGAMIASILTVGAPIKVANAMTNPATRQAMLTLKRSPKWQKSSLAAATYLGALVEKDGWLGSLQEQGQGQPESTQ